MSAVHTTSNLLHHIGGLWTHSLHSIVHLLCSDRFADENIWVSCSFEALHVLLSKKRVHEVAQSSNENTQRGKTNTIFLYVSGIMSRHDTSTPMLLSWSPPVHLLCARHIMPPAAESRPVGESMTEHTFCKLANIINQHYLCTIGKCFDTYITYVYYDFITVFVCLSRWKILKMWIFKLWCSDTCWVGISVILRTVQSKSTLPVACCLHTGTLAGISQDILLKSLENYCLWPSPQEVDLLWILGRQ